MADFIRRGVTKYKFATAIADKANPTRAEINAAINLGGRMRDISGFSSSTTMADAADMDSRFPKTIPGLIDVPDSTMVFKSSDAADSVKTALADLTQGYLLILLAGDVAGRKMEVWPCQIAGNNENHSFGNDVAAYTVNFSFTDEPAKNVTIPA